MEHITASFPKRAGPSGAGGPVHVIGAVNDVLQKHPPLGQDAQAVLFEHGRVVIHTRHAAAQARLQQDEPNLLTEINQTLRRRYNGPVVRALRFRITP